MQNRRLTAVAVAGALAIVGALVLVFFVQSAEDRALEGEEVVEVLVVQEDIPAGTPVSEFERPRRGGEGAGQGRQRRRRGRHLPAGRPRRGPEAPRRATSSPPPGSRPPRRSRRRGRRSRCPPGCSRSPSPSIPSDRSAAPCQPGDTVAFISSFTPDGEKTNIILHKLLVTNVQGAPSPRRSTAPDGTTESRPPLPRARCWSRSPSTEPSAQRIAFTSEFGTIYLAREPADAPGRPAHAGRHRLDLRMTPVVLVTQTDGVAGAPRSRARRRASVPSMWPDDGRGRHPVREAGEPGRSRTWSCSAPT